MSSRVPTISRIKDRQCNFFNRLSKLNYADAVVKTFMNLCKSTNIIPYYNSLHNHNKVENVRTRKKKDVGISELNVTVLCFYRSV